MWIRRLSELLVLAACATTSAVARGAPPAQTEAADDPLATYREQFKQGMDRYRTGAVAEAVGYWEPIYRELGEAKGYRLAYDLGLAYQELGDATHAAERLQTFLDEVGARRERGEIMAGIVEKEETDARVRIERLIASRGRIEVEAGDPPRSARVDASEPRLAGFVAWVAPGDHKVTFGAGTAEAETLEVSVRAGERVHVAPTPPEPPVPPPPQAEPPPAAALAPAPPPAPPLPPTRREVERPFPWALIAVSGALSGGAAVAAVPLYASAHSLYDRLASEPTISPSDRDRFARARTLAYSVAGGAVGLAAATAALAAWYVLGSSEREVQLTPSLDPARLGASLGVSGRF